VFDPWQELRNTRVVQSVEKGRGTDARTRDRVRSLLLELGPSTASVLGERLGLTPAGVRRHLDALVADGTVTAVTPRRAASRGPGRPARLFALTEAGHAAGPAAYDELAVGALRFLAEAAGEHAVERFAQERAAEFEHRYRDRLARVAVEERPAALAEALTGDGYAASTEPAAAGSTQLCQHHCPVSAVAERFPQLCDAETAALGRLLDTHVQRLATIAHGDGVCTLHVPAAPRPVGNVPAPTGGSR
jgi:predicted ArsR family transcriptional regulator